jgi:hypothetical protein
VAGLFVGFFLFGSTVERFWSFWHHSGSAGSLTLPQWLGAPVEVVVFTVVLMAIGMFWAGEKVERVFAERRSKKK